MANPTRAIDAVFFDIGKTLGDRDATGKLIPYPSTKRLLERMRGVLGLRIGVITTLGDSISTAEARDMLAQAGLAGFLDPQGFVSDHEAGTAKPDVAIYRFAANQVHVPIDRCLFVGENLAEVIGALTAGMKAVLKPSPPGPEMDG
jgi:FMN phosphatase YigB (HAD superfamily)